MVNELSYLGQPALFVDLRRVSQQYEHTTSTSDRGNGGTSTGTGTGCKVAVQTRLKLWTKGNDTIYCTCTLQYTIYTNKHPLRHGTRLYVLNLASNFPIVQDTVAPGPSTRGG